MTHLAESQVSSAQHATYARAQAIKKSEADWARPVCHYRPPAGWMNDPNGTIFHDGWFHLFYQHNPYGDQWAMMHWGHARSRDLIDWEELPIALAPRYDWGEEHCYSGCAAIGSDGVPRLFYTSVPFHRGVEHPKCQRVVRCNSTLTEFVVEKQPFLPAAAESSFRHDARDPFIFQSDGKTCLIYGAMRHGYGVVPLYQATDATLDQWTYVGDLMTWPAGTMSFPECPNMIPLGGNGGDKWLLVLSPFAAVEGILGTFSNGTFTPEQTVRLDACPNWYATNTLSDASGQVVILAWMRGWNNGRGWNGVLAAPRCIALDERSGIVQHFYQPWLQGLRQGVPQPLPTRVVNQAVVVDPQTGDTLELQATLTRSPGATVAITLGATAPGQGVVLRWHGDRLEVGTAQVALHLKEDPNRVTVHLVFDRSTVEISADGGRAWLSTVAVCPQRGFGLAISVAGGQVDVAGHWQALRAATWSDESMG